MTGGPTVYLEAGRWDGQLMVAVSFPYDTDIVELLKDAVPHRPRRWCRDEKMWLVEPRCADELIVELRAVGCTVHDHRPGPSSSPRRREPSWADHLFRAVGATRVEPVHRALTRGLHPEAATGDHELMAALNRARDRAAVKA